MPAARRLDAVVGDAGALVDVAAASRSSQSDVGAVLGPGVGSVARIVAAQDAVTALVEELRVETERRMMLERVLGRAEVDEEGRVVPPEPLTASSAIKANVAAEEAPPEVTKVDVATSPICPCPSPDPPPSPPPEQIPATVSILHQPTQDLPSDLRHFCCRVLRLRRRPSRFLKIPIRLFPLRYLHRIPL